MTGGARGIGRAIAELFVAQGDQVAVCCRSGCEDALPGTLFERVDVRCRPEVARFVKRAVDSFGSLDLLVNCAGISRWRSLEEIDEMFLSEILETNVMGTFWGCAAAASHMREGGAIVNISSLAGKRGSTHNSAYCAAKFAVNGITQALAKELGPRGIRVNAVCPVYVETERILRALAEPASPAFGQGVSQYLASFAQTQTALGRLPTTQEVAQAVYFLASPQASAITGQCINVDCGALPE